MGVTADFTARYRGHSSAGRAPALQAGGRRFDPAWLHQTLVTPTTTVHPGRCAFVVRVSGRKSRAMFFNNQENCILAFSDKREAIRSSYQFNLSHVAFVRPAPYVLDSVARVVELVQRFSQLAKRFFRYARRRPSKRGSVHQYVTE